MKLKIKFYQIFLFFICLLTIKNEALSLNEAKIPEGAYNIILKKKYSSICLDKEIKLSKDKLGSDGINFRIKKTKNKLINYSLNDSSYYTIEHMKTKLYVGIKINDTKINSLVVNKEIV